MIRLFTLLTFFCLCSFRYPGEFLFQFEQPFTVNSKEENLFIPASRTYFQENNLAEADSVSAAKILMLNYFAYDKGYPQDLKQLIRRRLPLTQFTDFWEGAPESLTAVSSGVDCIVISYPYSGQSEIVSQYAKVLQQYVRQGGTLIVTGTHKYNVLQQLELFDLDKSYYSKNVVSRLLQTDHPMTKGVDAEFSLQDFSYPLKTSDVAFQSLVEISGFPVAGIKPVGAGKVVYLGFEYYRDENPSATLLINAIAASLAGKPAKNLLTPRGGGKAEEYYWVNGAPKVDINVKVYPNPYLSAATLDVDLENPATVSIDMVDQTGAWVTTLLQPRNLSVGLYSFDLPNVAPGVYFIRCKVNGQTELRKVIKAEAD